LGLLALLTVAQAEEKKPARPVRGIAGKEAPAWNVTQWHQLPAGSETLEVTDFKGKVLYLYCFQSWCPGCHKSGFPTLKAVAEHFKDNDKVGFVTIQTVFEGAKANTFERGKQIVSDKFKLTIPFGQSGGKTRSPLMKAYRTGGTPWTIIIDPAGKVVFNDFHIKPKEAIRKIEEAAGIASK